MILQIKLTANLLLQIKAKQANQERRVRLQVGAHRQLRDFADYGRLRAQGKSDILHGKKYFRKGLLAYFSTVGDDRDQVQNHDHIRAVGERLAALFAHSALWRPTHGWGRPRPG